MPFSGTPNRSRLGVAVHTYHFISMIHGPSVDHIYTTTRGIFSRPAVNHRYAADELYALDSTIVPRKTCSPSRKLTSYVSYVLRIFSGLKASPVYEYLREW